MDQIIFLLLYTWATQIPVWVLGFALQLFCCAKGSTVVKKLLPLFAYLAGMAMCIVWGFVLSQDADAASVGLALCATLGVQMLVVELAWVVHWFKYRKYKKKYGTSDVKSEEE